MAGIVIIHAGTVKSLIDKIKAQDGGIASGISVNESDKVYKTLENALKTLTETGGVFSSSKVVSVGWKSDIMNKRGTFRRDKLGDNKYHALMDNLPAESVGGVFQQMNNPSYTGKNLENDEDSESSTDASSEDNQVSDPK